MRSFLLLLLFCPLQLLAQIEMPCKYCERIGASERSAILQSAPTPEPKGDWVNTALENFDTTYNTLQWATIGPAPFPNDRSHPATLVVYTDTMVKVENGALVLSSQRQAVTYGDRKRDWVSGLLFSKGADEKGGCFYTGRFEMGFRQQNSPGFAAALWLFGWAGEVDLLEMNGCDPTNWQSNVHNGGYEKGHRNQFLKHKAMPSLSDTLHTFTLEWSPNDLFWYHNGKAVRSMHRYFMERGKKRRPVSETVARKALQAGERVYINRLFLYAGHRMDVILSVGVHDGKSLPCSLNSGFDPLEQQPSANTYIDYLRIDQRSELKIKTPETVKLYEKFEILLPEIAETSLENLQTSYGLVLVSKTMPAISTFGEKTIYTPGRITLQGVQKGKQILRFPLPASGNSCFPVWLEKEILVVP